MGISIVPKIFWSHDPAGDVLIALRKDGLVLFADSKTGFTKFYTEKLVPILPEEGIIQSYTNHPAEGYFYFLYDSEVFSRQQAIDIILKFRQ
jgi:hypothetical protein